MNLEWDYVTALLQKLVDGTATPSQQRLPARGPGLCYTEEEIGKC